MKTSIDLRRDIAQFILNGCNLSEEEVALFEDLNSRGYSKPDFADALDWFQNVEQTSDLIGVCRIIVGREDALRIMSEEEAVSIPRDIYGYLMRCRELGLVNDIFFEDLMDKMLIVGANDLDLDDVKSLIMMHVLEIYRVDWQNRILDIQMDRKKTLN